MVRTSWLPIFVILSLPAVGPAQEAKFRWQSGQVLTYRVSQTTTAAEKALDKSVETVTKLDLVKKWQVLAVDASGIATLSMSLDRLRMETKSPTGEVLLFDSAAKDKSTPALAEELSKYVGSALTVVRVDGRGQLIEVKQSRFGPASRLEADLPFKLVLPATAVSAGQSWERKYQIKLEPPQGAGETFAAVQKLTCKSIANGSITIGTTTTIAGLPESPADQIPLLPLQPAGDAVFDIKSGRLKSIRYAWSKELPGYQGEGSKYTFTTTYIEDLQ